MQLSCQFSQDLVSQENLFYRFILLYPQCSLVTLCKGCFLEKGGERTETKAINNSFALNRVEILSQDFFRDQYLYVICNRNLLTEVTV